MAAKPTARRVKSGARRMDLETFVAETLRQINKGVETAQQNQECKGAWAAPSSQEWMGGQEAN
jgi:hypothetical protein